VNIINGSGLKEALTIKITIIKGYPEIPTEE
jgi:hypothetical protein